MPFKTNNLVLLSLIVLVAVPSLAQDLTETQEAKRDRLLSAAQQARADGDLDRAAEFGEQMLALEIAGLGAEHEQELAALENLAGIYEESRDWSKAIEKRSQVLSLSKSIHGEQDWKTTDARLALDYAQLRSNLNVQQQHQLVEAADLATAGVASFHEAKYTEAIHLMQSAARIRLLVLGKNHPKYATMLGNLALLLYSTGDYAKAEPLYLKCLEIRKQVLGEQHPDYTTTLNNLAALYKSTGNYAKAEPLYLKCLEIRKQVLGEQDPQYATTLNNLAVLYLSLGDYARAEALLLQSQRIRKHVLGEQHPDYGTTLNNLALLHALMGNYARAEPMYRQCLEIRKKVHGEQHPDYAITLGNLADLYDSLGDYARAEPLYLRCREIEEIVLGEKHPGYANTLCNLAGLYTSVGDYARAEPLLLQCQEIRKQVLGEQHPDCATTLNNLALLYHSIGDYARAEPLYLQSLDITWEVLSDEHPQYANTLNNLADLYRSLREYERAEPLAYSSLENTFRHLEATALIQSERQQLAMNQKFRFQLDDYISLVLDGGGEYPVKAARAALTWKGATLVRQRAMREAASEPAIAERFVELQQVSRRLAALAAATDRATEDGWRAQIQELTAEKERLESELSRDSATFRQAMERVTPEMIQAAIPEDGVLIDYLQFTRSKPAEEKGKWEYTTSMLAIVVRHTDEPTILDLGPIAPLSESIDIWRQTYGMSPRGREAGAAIRAQIWEPLLPHIGDATTVLVSTDGALGRMPIAALPGQDAGTYLLEDHRIAMIAVPQLLPALVNEEGRKALSRELLLLGDVDYDGDPNEEPTTPKKKARRSEALHSGTFEPLEGAAGEIATISQLFRETFDGDADDVHILKRQDAGESQFRSFAPQFFTLHIATHGFFASAEVESAFSEKALQETRHRSGSLSGMDSGYVRGMNPGLLSGLALAGANRSPEPGEDDGILTAQEIAFLPLDGVETVVLSACETGLGEVAGGEGLIGIQRAFQVAGVRTTLASYWKVDDEITRQFMERFYREQWEGGLSPLDALRETQLQLLRGEQSEALQLSAEHRHALKLGGIQQDQLSISSPYYWGAFQLSGDWK